MPRRISAKDLAAMRYPAGDVRNAPEVRAWLKADREVERGERPRPPSPLAWHTWCSWNAWTGELDRRVTIIERGPDHPLSRPTVRKLRKLAETIRQEVAASRP